MGRRGRLEPPIEPRISAAQPRRNTSTRLGCDIVDETDSARQHLDQIDSTCTRLRSSYDRRQLGNTECPGRREDVRQGYSSTRSVPEGETPVSFRPEHFNLHWLASDNLDVAGTTWQPRSFRQPYREDGRDGQFIHWLRYHHS